MANQIGEKWTEYRPTKGVWFGSCAACIVATLIVGFSWGGWVTEGTASEMVESSAGEARATLAADMCEYRFMNDPEARTNLASFQEEDSWKQDQFLEDGGWVTFAAIDEPVEDSAELCAERLADREVPEEEIREVDASGSGMVDEVAAGASVDGSDDTSTAQ